VIEYLQMLKLAAEVTVERVEPVLQAHLLLAESGVPATCGTSWNHQSGGGGTGGVRPSLEAYDTLLG